MTILVQKHKELHAKLVFSLDTTIKIIIMSWNLIFLIETLLNYLKKLRVKSIYYVKKFNLESKGDAVIFDIWYRYYIVFHNNNIKVYR